MNRVQLIEARSRFIFPIDNSEWPYTAATRDKVQAQAREHATKVIEALDRHSGRTLTTAELYGNGVEHFDDTPTAAKVQILATSTEPAAPGNPGTLAKEMGLHRPNKRATRKDMYDDLERTWEAERQAKAAAEKSADEPWRARAIEIATKAYTSAKFDPLIPTRELQAAAHRLQVARTGSRDEFRQLQKSHEDTEASKLASREAELDQAIADLKAKKRALSECSFEPPEPETPRAPLPSERVIDGIRVTPMYSSDFAKLPGTPLT